MATVVVAAFIGVASHHLDSMQTDVCNTPECVAAAASMLEGVDNTVDPCEDFYAYSCNGWLKENYIKDSEGSISQFRKLGDRNADLLNARLTDKTQMDSPTIGPAVKWYTACRNMSYTDDVAPQEFKKVILPKITPDASLTSTMSALHELGISAFFYADIGPDDKNPEIYGLFIGQGKCCTWHGCPAARPRCHLHARGHCPNASRTCRAVTQVDVVGWAERWIGGLAEGLLPLCRHANREKCAQYPFPPPHEHLQVYGTARW